MLHGQPIAAPCVILSGGETTVTVRGNGRGGRNAEFLLAFTEALQGLPGVYALAGDTDGIDGSEDNAGALMTPDSFARAEALGLRAAEALANNDGYGYFAALDSLIVTDTALADNGALTFNMWRTSRKWTRCTHGWIRACTCT